MASAAPEPSPSLIPRDNRGFLSSRFNSSLCAFSLDSCQATQCSKEPETVASKQAAAAVQIKPSSITGIDFDLALAIEPTMAANSLRGSDPQ